MDSAGEWDTGTLHEHATDGGNSIGAESRDGAVKREAGGRGDVDGGNGDTGTDAAGTAPVAGNKNGTDRSSIRCFDLQCTTCMRASARVT